MIRDTDQLKSSNRNPLVDPVPGKSQDDGSHRIAVKIILGDTADGKTVIQKEGVFSLQEYRSLSSSIQCFQSGIGWVPGSIFEIRIHVLKTITSTNIYFKLQKNNLPTLHFPSTLNFSHFRNDWDRIARKFGVNVNRNRKKDDRKGAITISRQENNSRSPQLEFSLSVR